MALVGIVSTIRHSLFLYIVLNMHIVCANFLLVTLQIKAVEGIDKCFIKGCYSESEGQVLLLGI